MLRLGLGRRLIGRRDPPRALGAATLALEPRGLTLFWGAPAHATVLAASQLSSR